MDYRNFTIQAQGMIQQAFLLAEEHKHRAVETGHLLKAILAGDNALLQTLLVKQGKNRTDVDYQLDNLILEYPNTLGEELYMSLEANRALMHAVDFASALNGDMVSEEHILFGITSVRDKTSSLLKGFGITREKLEALLRDAHKDEMQMDSPVFQPDDILLAFTTNLNLEAINGRLNPFAGREEEMNSMMQILSRRTKNNVLLIGDPGVGKTSIIEGLASWIVQERVPEDFRKKQLLKLNLEKITSGAEQESDLQQLIQQLMQRLRQESENMLLFIDDMDYMTESERKSMSDTENIIRSLVLSDAIQLIATTTLDRYYMHDDHDKALVNKFQPLMISEPGAKEAVSMLRALKPGFEDFHKVFIQDEAIVSAVEWSVRYITDRFLPGKAVELIDEAASRIHLEMVSVPDEIVEVEKKITTLEVERKMALEEKTVSIADEIAGKIENLNEQAFKLKARFHLERSIYEDTQQLRLLLNRLRKRAEQARKRKNYDLAVDIRLLKIRETEQKLKQLHEKLDEIQQDSPMINANVTKDIVAEIISKKSGIPTETMLRDENELLLHLEEELRRKVFGQPEAIKAVAEVLRRRKAGLVETGKPVAAFLFAGSTGAGKTEMAKALSLLLFGSEKRLVQIRMEEYQESHSVSRLIGSTGDEPSNPEKGRLLDAVRKMPYAVVLIRNIELANPDVLTFLIQLLTLGHAVDPQGRKISFRNTVMIMTTRLAGDTILLNMSGVNENDRSMLYEETSDLVLEAVKTKLPETFMNLMEDFVMFVPLHTDDLLQVIRLQLQGVKETLLRQHVKLEIHERAMEWFAMKSMQQNDGVRSARKIIQKHLLNRLSEDILSGKVKKENEIFIDLGNNGITIRNRSDE